MFVVTLGKKGLRKLGAVAVCGVVLTAAVMAAAGTLAGSSHSSQPVNASPAAQQAATVKVEGSAQVQEFFQLFGLEVDLASATVDKVKIPKKWDESFSAFNTVVKESGLDLEKSKGKSVEKWMVLCPSLSAGEDSCYGVVLVYKQKPVGAYLLHQPSGEVVGLASVSQSASAPLTEEEAQQANAEFGSEAAPASADEVTSQPAESTPADSQPQPVNALVDEDFFAADAGGIPTE